MRTLCDEVAITFDREKITLRPSLKAAIRLEKLHGSFDKIVRDIAEQNVATMADVIRETSGQRSELLHFLEVCADDAPLMLKVGALVEPLVSVVLAIVGVDPEEAVKERKDSAPAKPVSFAEHHADLFRIGTGWLGWSPEATLNATPAEILEAYKGRISMLKAIFGTSEGGGDDKDKNASTDWQRAALEKSDEETRAEFHAGLAALGVTPGQKHSFGTTR